MVYPMKSKLDFYIEKYGTIANILANAPRNEIDDYLLASNYVDAAYDDHFLSYQHSFDYLIANYFLNKEPLSFFIFDESHPLFSLCANQEFVGESNLFHPPGYLLGFFKEELTFTSLGQYFFFQASVLFLDIDFAKEILLKKRTDSIQKMHSVLRNFNQTVWSKHQIKIMENGVKLIFDQVKEFRDHLLQTKENFIVYDSGDTFWGGEVDKISPSGSNYLGKILMKIRIESLKDSKTSKNPE